MNKLEFMKQKLDSIVFVNDGDGVHIVLDIENSSRGFLDSIILKHRDAEYLADVFSHVANAWSNSGEFASLRKANFSVTAEVMLTDSTVEYSRFVDVGGDEPAVTIPDTPKTVYAPPPEIVREKPVVDVMEAFISSIASSVADGSIILGTHEAKEMFASSIDSALGYARGKALSMGLDMDFSASEESISKIKESLFPSTIIEAGE